MLNICRTQRKLEDVYVDLSTPLLLTWGHFSAQLIVDPQEEWEEKEWDERDEGRRGGEGGGER